MRLRIVGYAWQTTHALFETVMSFFLRTALLENKERVLVATPLADWNLWVWPKATYPKKDQLKYQIN